MIPAGPLYHKPKAFVSAKNLLYSSICIGIFNVILNKLTPVVLGEQIIILLTVVLIGYLLLFYFVKQMSFCKKWARAALLFVCIVITALYVTICKVDKNVNFFEGALILLQFLFQVTALVFLYNKECSTWFNSRTSEILP